MHIFQQIIFSIHNNIKQYETKVYDIILLKIYLIEVTILFLEERYEKIIECIESEGRVTVKALSDKFKVTEDCIRKDLRELESRGNLKRVYGGAIIQRSHNNIKPLDENGEVVDEEYIKKHAAEIAKKKVDAMLNKDSDVGK